MLAEANYCIAVKILDVDNTICVNEEVDQDFLK